jgi:hypothetical protein
MTKQTHHSKVSAISTPTEKETSSKFSSTTKPPQGNKIRVPDPRICSTSPRRRMTRFRGHWSPFVHLFWISALHHPDRVCALQLAYHLRTTVWNFDQFQAANPRNEASTLHTGALERMQAALRIQPLGQPLLLDVC